MSSVETTKRIVEGSPRTKGTFVAIYYLLAILTGAFSFLVRGRWDFAADVVATVFYGALASIFVWAVEAGEPQERTPILPLLD